MLSIVVKPFLFNPQSHQRPQVVAEAMEIDDAPMDMGGDDAPVAPPPLSPPPRSPTPP